MSNTNQKSPAVQAAEFWLQNKIRTKPLSLIKRDPKTGLPVDAEAAGNRELPYYLSVKYEGRRCVRCLKTNDKNKAQDQAAIEAVNFVAGIIGGETEKPKTPAVATGKLKQLLAAYMDSPVDANDKTRALNCYALRQFVRHASGIPEPERGSKNPNGPELELAVTVITGETSSAYFTAKSKDARGTSDQSEQVTIKRSANSRFRQAKSVFVPKALAVYRKRGLYHPGFDEFVKEGDVYKFGKLPTLAYVPAPDKVIKATLEAWEKIGATGDVSDADRNLFLAIGHELVFGVRIGELKQATWGWWIEREGHPWLDNGSQKVNVKNGSGMISVRAVDPWFTIMNNRIKARGWNLGPDGQVDPNTTILVGTETARTDTVFRNVSAFMRKLGWTTTHTNHELRNYVGSQITMRYSPYDAQCWLRHSSVTVTQGHYNGYVKKHMPADVTTMAVRWATLEQVSPLLRLVNSEE